MIHWQDRPFRIEVKAGETKALCTCGQSATPPLCDGSHRGTGLKPDLVRFEHDGIVLLCGCGRTADEPRCDGSHRG